MTMMKRSMIVLGVLAIGFVLGRLSAPSPTGASVPVVQTKIAPDQTVRPSASTQYFQRMLIENGAEAGNTFGDNLASLGLNGRQLQAMPIDQAYTLAHNAALRLQDITTRRRYLLELFNETEDR